MIESSCENKDLTSVETCNGDKGLMVDSQSPQNENHDSLALPAPNDELGNPSTTQLPLGGTVSMDHLGPIIINTDGTTKRIANWDQLTKAEQENTIRVISARNKKRIEALKKQQDEISGTS